MEPEATLSHHVPDVIASVIVSYMIEEHVQYLRTKNVKWIHLTPQYFDADFVYQLFPCFQTVFYCTVANGSTSMLTNLERKDKNQFQNCLYSKRCAPFAVRHDNRFIIAKMRDYGPGITYLDVFHLALRYNQTDMANWANEQFHNVYDLYYLALIYNTTDHVQRRYQDKAPAIHAALLQSTSIHGIESIVASTHYKLDICFAYEIIRARHKLLLQYKPLWERWDLPFEIKAFHLPFDFVQFIHTLPHFKLINEMEAACLSHDINYVQCVLDHGIQVSDLEDALIHFTDYRILLLMTQSIGKIPLLTIPTSIYLPIANPNPTSITHYIGLAMELEDKDQIHEIFNHFVKNAMIE